ncbi:MAG: YHS domain-containing protein [bacterium]|nr:YHS domain-containing protein [bacterium]
MIENNLKLVKDVVCGMVKPIDQMKSQTIYKDIIYYFCSDVDKNMFLANPDHWKVKK